MTIVCLRTSMLDARYKIIKGKRENLPWIGSVDSSFPDYDKKANLAWACEIWIKLEETNDIGFPSETEFSKIESFEDTLCEDISSHTGSFLIGKITWNSKRYILIYIEDPKLVFSSLDKMIQDRRYEREFEFKIQKDISWTIAGKNFSI